MADECLARPARGPVDERRRAGANSVRLDPVHARRLLPALAATTAVVVLATLVALAWRTWAPPEGADAATATRADPDAPAPESPAAILARWDARRAAAWERGDAEQLAGLYVAGSRAGAADVRLLRRYASRGLRVADLQTQVLALDVVTRGPERLHLVVTDRVVGGTAVGRGRSVRLPRDRPSTRRVVLVLVDGRWLVDRVG